MAAMISVFTSGFEGLVESGSGNKRAQSQCLRSNLTRNKSRRVMEASRAPVRHYGWRNLHLRSPKHEVAGANRAQIGSRAKV